MAARARDVQQQNNFSRYALSSDVRPLCRAIAVMLAAGMSMHAQAAGITNLGQATRTTAGGAGSYGGTGLPNLGVSPQQALKASQPSILNLGHAAQIAAQIAAQHSAAAAAGAAASNVPNGLTPGGLQVAPGVTADTNSALLWYNANAPTQTVDGNGHVSVDIQQTGQNSVLTWQTMNVGRQTTLNFDQSRGTQTNGANNWAVLNRIMDPSGRPSQILGSINAQGAVYVIDRNGIVFGAGSQINVHSLVASSLNLLDMKNEAMPSAAGIVASNQAFLSLPAGTTGGLAYPESGNSSTVNGSGITPNEILGLGNVSTVSDPYQVPGDVTIEQGASITTHVNGTVSDGGFVMVAAPNVTNAGSISATDGQVVLAAGVGVSVTPNAQGAKNPQVLLPELSGQVVTAQNDSTVDITPAGTLSNTGIVQAARGNVNLLGSSVAQNGVVGVTTSVNTPGTITISTVDEYMSNNPLGHAYPGASQVNDTSTGGGKNTRRAGLLSFGPDSVTAVLPDTDGQTATSTPGTTFTPGDIQMTAGSVWFQGGSLIEAPGSGVTVTALTQPVAGYTTPAGDTAVAGRILLGDGATIDVSGLANVELPISAILLTIDRIGQNELADSPLLRNSFLNGMKGIVVDSTFSGTRSDGLQWVGSPILNLTGYVNDMPRTVDQLLTNGGTITLSGNEVMTAKGSSMNLNGGYVHYDGGIVNTTRLVDANGAIVPIGQASPYDTYVGIAGEFVESHPRWGVTKDWYNPLQTGGVYEPEFIVGGNAGTLDLYATEALVLDGDISAQAFGGSKQMQGNALPAGGTFNLGADPNSTHAADLLNLTQNGLGSNNGELNQVILRNSAPDLNDLVSGASSGFSIDTPLDTAALGALPSTDPDNVLATIVVPVDTLNAGGFSNLNVTGDNINGKGFSVAEGTTLALQPGGSITLSGGFTGNSTVAGQIVVPSGRINISNGGDITVTPTGKIDAAGQWVNNDTQAAPDSTPGNSQYIDGGSISLSAGGHLDLQAGSMLDVSSGGEMRANGQLLMSDGIPEGKGGNVSLIADNANYLARIPTDPYLTMNGEIRSLGFSGGGTLTLAAPGFQIGGDASAAPAWAVTLPADFFAKQGFGGYVLNAHYDADVAPDTTVRLTQQNLLANATALQQAVSGSDLGAGGLTTVGTLDAYHRQPTGLVMTAGDARAWAAVFQKNSFPYEIPATVTGAVTIGQGASVIADAGASIGLGSPVQVTVLGSLIAPGGSITLSVDNTGPYLQSGQFNGQTSSYNATPGSVGSGLISSPYLTSSQSVWLGADALLDVAGVALTDPLASPVKNGLMTFIPDTGKVLAGGSVTMSSNTGYIVAGTGSQIDVSGVSANFDQLQANGTYASQPAWSDAGSITLGASNGLLFDGTLRAQPGAQRAEGGTLTILPEQLPGISGAAAIVVRQSGNLVPAGLAVDQDITGLVGAQVTDASGNTTYQPTRVLQFAADRLAGSGISTLVLGDSSTLTRGSSVTPVPVAFAGDVNIAVPKAVQIYTNRLLALNAGQLDQLTHGVKDASGQYTIPTIGSLLNGETGAQTPTSIGSTVNLRAPYVELAGPALNNATSNLATVAAASDSTLNVNASFIDLVNQFQLNNFGQANFTSGGDIRLTSTSAANGQLALGLLYTPGNLSFTAADLYPSTGTSFLLDAVGATDTSTGKLVPTTIAFQSNGASSTPLSAGGTLLVDASHIVQGGTIRAPSGSLVFGVGDPNDGATQTQFGNLPLVATDSVAFTNGSLTSVSDGGIFIPYGTTVDGVEWQFNPVSGTTQPDLTAPPARYIGANGGSVALNKGASIDLSGGGNLQAEEWVPGTGGTRDVLSQYNVSYANSSNGVAVPVNANGGNVYAIIPGKQSPLSAYDPVFAQSVQPTSIGGTTTGQTGVGQAGMGSEIGQSVYLSGVPGLADGYYTLLPGKYATLPGAFRVTLAGTGGSAAPGASRVLPDGSVVTSGYFGDSLTGSRSATPTLFNVQSGAVWQQYSQYNLKDADSFFTALAATKGNVTPPLPMDGGQLVLAATKALTLGATLNTAAAQGGAPAEVDIASQDIQITGNGAAALPGYLQIDADALDSLAAGSLLIGGTRKATASGITITPIANSVVVSNDGNSALTGPEILLVTKTDASGADPDAANGLRIDAGAAITATGDYPAAKDVPLAISGDGALLRVSDGAMAPLSRTGGAGLLTVGAGATLSGGEALLLDSSGDLKVDPTAVLSARAVTADGSAITFTSRSGGAAANLPGFVLDTAGLAQLANAQQVTLRSYGAINFVGDVDATFGNSVDLSAGTFASDGGNVTLNAQQIAFTNEAGAPQGTAATGSGTLTVNAKEIDFGTGDKVVSGFGSATLNATGGIVGQNKGTFDFGALPVTLDAPVYLADTGSAATVKTTGLLTLDSAAGTARGDAPVGGAFSFIGGTLNDNGATIVAPAGNVSLEATTGDLTVGGGSLVSAAGVSKQFFDVAAYAPAGTITLTADRGTVDVQSGSTLDFSGAGGGGAAGALVLSAPQQIVNLDGTLKGGAAGGYAGGSFSLDTGGAANLDSLANTLAASGVNQAVAIHTKTGNLTLSAGNTLTAQAVSLIADGGAGNASDTANGNVNVLGKIDASGTAGGEIDLYGRGGVDVEGTLLARGSDANQRGGTVNIGTSGRFDPNAANPYNTAYGYENIDPANSGRIVVGADALIDVSGGTAGGLSGGAVNFRAPLLANGTVDLQLPGGGFNTGRGIVGSRATTLEAYAVWSTTDATSGAQHFDGVVDPAGWYDSNGNLLAGTFTSQDGKTSITYTPANGNTPASLSSDPGATADQLAKDLADLLQNDDFAPTGANTDHQTFYGYQDGDATKAAPGTLMGFVGHGLDTVNNPFAGTGIANARIVPGIELDNPDAGINNGDIQVLTNWNLGAGTSPTDLAFRFNGEAPVITFRAENNVKVKASLTDGFFQIANPVASGGSITVPSFEKYGTYSAAEYAFNAAGGSYPGTGTSGSGLAYYASRGLIPEFTNINGADPQAMEEYYALYTAYAHFLDETIPSDQASAFGVPGNYSYLQYFWLNNGAATTNGAPPAPPAPVTSTDLASYAHQYFLYLNQYATYIQTLANQGSSRSLPFPPQAPSPALNIAPIDSSTIALPTPADNTPSPAAVATNPLPLSSASLIGGSSTSWRVVAGADTRSANPLALQAASIGQNDTGVGSVTLDGHTAYVDPNGQTLFTPTMIRTGTGSIDVAAGNDIALLDMVAPGAIYTAGAPSADAPAAGNTAAIVKWTGDTLVSPAVNPDSAGDITLHAQGDIQGVEYTLTTSSSGAVAGTPGQFWTPWMEITPNPSSLTRTSIDFGAFDQGVMSVGGNVSVSAGGNISDLAVSLPTTWYLTNSSTGTPIVNTVGGGNLTVHAGGDILSGDYFVAKGNGTITAGGLIGSDVRAVPNGVGADLVPVATILALQDGMFNVSARQGVDIGSILNPSYSSGALAGTAQKIDGQGYSATSGVNILSTTGDVTFGSFGGLLTSASGTLPASLDLTAFNGGINVESAGTLYPSAVGQLNLIADQSVSLSNLGRILTGSPVPNTIGNTFSTGDGTNPANQFGMSDADPSQMPSPTQPLANASTHDTSALHADDPTPVRIYSLNGSIVDGTLSDSGFYDNLISVSIDKPALIQAGQDIVNLAFDGQNLRRSDVTRIVAGRDIYDTPVPDNGGGAAPVLMLGGPGTFDIEAGRNIGPLTSQQQLFDAHATGSSTVVVTGIDAVGNANNPNLPHESADINVLFGVGPGIDLATFESDYIASGSAVAGVASTTPALIAFMEKYDAGLGVDTGLQSDSDAARNKVGTLSAAQAWTQFQALPSYVRQLFAEQVLFNVLTQVGEDYNNAASPYFQQYARGYQAINTLFPASFGYTANNLDGGTNGANQLASTGNLDIRSTTIQTQQGGNVSILGPGGQALVGSTTAPPAIVDSNGKVVAGPGTMGILTLEKGDIDIFTDQSVLLAQSRIFTEQGGDMTIWSSNGDINAGKGAKTSADMPAPQYVCDPNHYCTVDARGEVTGAGIATLQSIPGVPLGTINLIAPRGTVDAGDAGIRAGNINVAALQVLNADNIQVSGKATGIPVVQAVNSGALTAASSAASAASQMAQDIVKNNASGGGVRRWAISVQVEGFGNAGSEDDSKKKRGAERVGYDRASAVSILGFGSIGPAQRAALDSDERERMGRM